MFRTHVTPARVEGRSRAAVHGPDNSAEFRGFRRFSLEFIDILVKIQKKWVSDLGANPSESSLEHADMGANPSDSNFSLFVFPGFSLGALGTVLELFGVPLGSPWGSLGRLGGSLAALGGYFGLTLLHRGSPWPLCWRIVAAFAMKLGAFGAERVISACFSEIWDDFLMLLPCMMHFWVREEKTKKNNYINKLPINRPERPFFKPTKDVTNCARYRPQG